MSRKVDARAVHDYIDSLSKPAGDKLPNWPTYPSTAVTGPEWMTYQLGVRDAALARMEALVEYAQHKSGWRDGCASLGETTLAYRNKGLRGCTCGLSELLAACERSKS